MTPDAYLAGDQTTASKLEAEPLVKSQGAGGFRPPRWSQAYVVSENFDFSFLLLCFSFAESKLPVCCCLALPENSIFGKGLNFFMLSSLPAPKCWVLFDEHVKSSEM